MLRVKILLLAILPLFIAVSTIIFVLFLHSDDLVDRQIERVEVNVLSSKHDELRHYMHMALTAVDHIYQEAQSDDEQAKERVKAILNDMTYGPDGYFFVYDGNGTGLVHPTQPEIIGLNWWGLQDSQGRMVIKELTERARAGGGFYRYLWEKPSDGKVAEKLSYAVMLEKWDWMIGTGIYLDELYMQINDRKGEVKFRIERIFFLIFWIAVIAIIAIFVSGILINANERKLADNKLKELTQRIVEFQEEERGRVSRELHDGISQLLVSIKYSVERAVLKTKKGEEDAVDSMDKALGGLHNAIGEVRRISRDLRPRVLDDIGLSAALGAMSDEFSDRTGIKTHFIKHSFTKQLTPEIKTTLFRIAQEALTNIERHSGASEVRIELSKRSDGIKMIITDDGIGFDVLRMDGRKNTFQGIGLRNMQERIEFHGGELMVWSSSEKGTVIEAKLPLKILREKI
jgi:two-component system NarL family sensor kinase